MAGLDPAIHVDDRIKSGHDDQRSITGRVGAAQQRHYDLQDSIIRDRRRDCFASAPKCR
jgi:hypothetical protein